METLEWFLSLNGWDFFWALVKLYFLLAVLGTFLRYVFWHKEND
ncbi:hypothetical protein GCWU000324_01023 [Kingella oralis ATCC 51147]|uniref:Uncharacterized protein n=2 Tax=root TaxID=1 RepID=C4GFV6_9NEIS|nr:hypothetical protein GCWU000324_01023 [Kingella oralis ATCC 51147]DAD69530.1 MAG TPA: hypothetical protein [Siphoviridae sp. ctR0j7]DAO73014.1 MAG TPA: hypothetical protein [Caudoviricetes sp.]DAT92753.1 MAG TPA: hypothetical protein [Caudoviricetes sp.]DAX37372.1 MAG TPA: hypothetical protein [Caudoviricetes sp.]